MNENSLEHYGIKGMHWGVRRTPEQLGNKKAKVLRKQKKVERRYNKYHGKVLRLKYKKRPNYKKLAKFERKSDKYELKVMRGKRKLDLLNEALDVSKVLDRIASENNTTRKNVRSDATLNKTFRTELKKQERENLLLSHADKPTTLADLFADFTEEQMEVVYLYIDELFDDGEDEDEDEET